MGDDQTESSRGELAEPETEETRNRRRKVETLIALGTPPAVAERMAAPYKPDELTESVLDGIRGEPSSAR